MTELHNIKWDEFRALLRSWKVLGLINAEQYWEMLYLVEKYGYASVISGIDNPDQDRKVRYLVNIQASHVS